MQRFPKAPAIFLDFDGCLVDLAPTPDAVQVPIGLVPLLHRLHRATQGALAIVSGRPSWDLRRFLLGLSLPMIASHGAEVLHGRGRIDTIPVDRDVLVKATERAAAILGDTPGLLLERKPVAVCLHYRGAPEQGPRIRRAAQALADESPGFFLHHAKEGVELRPEGVGKGDAVARLMRSAPFQGRAPVMFGDDATDEAAFAVVQRAGGMGIKVGPGATQARRRLGRPALVRESLLILARQVEAADG